MIKLFYDIPRKRIGRNFLHVNNCSIHRICIVGSGPSGFYSAKYLIESNSSIHVDIIDRVPTPFGLIRYGVAPDHPEVKSVISTFSEVASNPRVRFYGNITVGRDISVKTLLSKYSGVILAYGASSDRKLNIPGEDDTHGVLSARTFVNWYNAHPDYANLPLLTTLGDKEGYAFHHPHRKSIQNVVIIGQGNVAVDCARILCKSYQDLAATDISTNFLSAFHPKATDINIQESDLTITNNISISNNVKNVYVTGRRGAAQASFTIKEIRELTKIPYVKAEILESDLVDSLTEATKVELTANKPKNRIFELLKAISTLESKDFKYEKNIHFRFLLAPKRILSDTDSGWVTGVEFERQVLVGPAHRQQCEGTGQLVTIPCDLLLRSIGYAATQIDTESIPFDPTTSTVPSIAGRAVRSMTSEALPGLYVTGWLKRGPTGIIGSNIPDAKETVTSVLEDLTSVVLVAQPDDPIDCPEMKSVFETKAVTWQDFCRIDAYEMSQGGNCVPKKVREKMTSLGAMLELIQSTLPL